MNPLNSPIEVGIRALVLLSECFPRPLDVAQLVYLDHAVLHSGDLDGGPSSLHPDLPIGPGELGMRRRSMEQGLLVLLRAGLAVMATSDEGFAYQATEESSSFLNLLEAPYVGSLKQRAAWLMTVYLREMTDVRQGMRQITERWVNGLDAGARLGGEDGEQCVHLR
ncbi:hypothetical protein ABH920_002636 [Catenulispora sp. EB89]|uniref:ABC-three component system middle component 2 n=1 Tax=Catenulispora sp. EB89 TaxID=3156257 RepID=UPI003518E3A7